MINTTEETTLTETETNSWDGVTTTDVYEADNIRITYILTSFRDTGYNAVIRIENTGSECIENWCVELVSDTVITDIYNAKIAENTDNKYVIKNAGWNQDIAAGSHVEFGVSGNSAFAGFAKNYRLTGESTQVSDSDYSVAYHVDSDWGSGFTGSISITNNTYTVLEDWVLEFDLTKTL